MKFVLGLVAIIIISLAVYVTMGSNGTQQVQKEVAKAVQPKEEVSQVVPAKVKAKKSSVKNITVKSPKVVSKEVNQEMENKDEIGKGITQEDIDNAKSDEERELMEIDMLTYHSNHIISLPPPTKDEERQIIEDGVKDGIL